MKVSLRWVALTFTVILLFCTDAKAQDSACDCSFKNLKDLYLVGQFAVLKSNINCCLNTPKRLSLNEMNRMKELLSLVAIAQDDLNRFIIRYTGI